MSQPTVVRRIAALEEACGLLLFERHPKGYQLTEHGTAILPLAQRVEAEVAAVASNCAARMRQATSAIRLTVPETLASFFIMPALTQFRESHPGVQVQLISTDERLDVSRGEADIALRAGEQGPDEDLVGWRLPDPAWTVYGSQDYFARSGTLENHADLKDHALIGGEGPVAALDAFKWLDRIAPEAAIVWRGNTLSSIQAAVRAGLGVAPLPCALGGLDPALEPCFPPVPELDSVMWIVTRPELRREPFVNQLMKVIRNHILKVAPIVRGERRASADE